MTPVYLDCNASTPMDPEVTPLVTHWLTEEFGNEGSRTHEFGTRAKAAVSNARREIARVVDAKADEIVFTSGATESNNLAILGLMRGAPPNKRHIVTTSIEHKAVLEPIEALEREGCEVTRVAVGASGIVDPEELHNAVRPETHLVSVMAANNETGMRQPIEAIASLLPGETYFHVDAAQAFGREIVPLKNQRIDMLSVSGHKIFGPKGIGALILRRRGSNRPPLLPLVYGGGQERGLRAGTLAVPLIAGLGAAAEAAERCWAKRQSACISLRKEILDALSPLNPIFSGDPANCLPHVLNLRFEGLDSEAIMVATKDLIAISNGSACTSTSYKPSHVLCAMGMTADEANGCIRISWCHLTPSADWHSVALRIASLF